MDKISVCIVEDEPELLKLFSQIIESSPDLSCYLAVDNCENALKNMADFCPDVVLMDINLPGMNGIEGTRKVKSLCPNCDIIMLTIQEENDYVFDSLCAGASGYLLKDSSPNKILQAIIEVKSGGSPMSPSIARKVIKSFHPAINNPLSDRELEVLKKLTQGQNYNTIANSLFISGNTVKAHIKNIYRKLEVNSRASAVEKAIHKRLI